MSHYPPEVVTPTHTDGIVELDASAPTTGGDGRSRLPQGWHVGRPSLRRGGQWAVYAALAAFAFIACATAETASPDVAPIDAAPTETPQTEAVPIGEPIMATPLPRPRFFARQIIFTVINNSDDPATLVVADDTSPIERDVGNANPRVVPAFESAEVVFRVSEHENLGDLRQ